MGMSRANSADPGAVWSGPTLFAIPSTFLGPLVYAKPPCSNLGNNCIQNVHLGRYVVGYMVGNFVFLKTSHFQPYNQWYISPNENFECGYPRSNALFNIYSSKAQHFAPNWSFISNVKQLRQPITSDITYDVGAAIVYCRIYWHKFLTLSNQTSCYIRKCIRILITAIISDVSVFTIFRVQKARNSLFLYDLVQFLLNVLSKKWHHVILHLHAH